MIIDATTLTKDKKIYGHFLKVSKNYLEFLGKKFDVNIVGGKTYYEYKSINKFINLPFYIKFSLEKSKWEKILDQIKQFINTKKALAIKSDIYLFQSYCTIPILLGILLSSRKNIYMIRYRAQEKSKIIQYLYTINRKKIKGIIGSNKEYCESYRLPYCLVNDYLYMEEKKSEVETTIDLLVIGTMSAGKDLEGLIEGVKHSKMKILIVGNFEDKKRYNTLCGKINGKENINIIDKYLSEEEYNQYIEQSKCIALPYTEIYNNMSSGVLLEALYAGKIVVAPNLDAFKIIKEKNIGYLYEENIQEVLMKINSNLDEKNRNLKKYLKEIEMENKKLYKFLEK